MAKTVRDAINDVLNSTGNALGVVLIANTDGTYIGDIKFGEALPANTDGVYIGDIKFGESLPAGTAAIGKLAANSGVDIGDTDSRDLGPGWTTTMGLTSQARFTSADQSSAAADITSAPTSSQKIVVTDVVISVDTAMRVDLKEETAGTVFLSVYMAANSAMQVTPRGKFKLNTADKKLQVQTSAAGNIAVQTWYYSES